jgi:hypothetical protein
MRIAAQPTLYSADSKVPSLAGTWCSACGRVYFPPLSLGCEVCGAGERELRPVELEAAGVIHSHATVYVQHGKFPAPFTIAEIQLYGGPLIRAVLRRESARPEIGQAVSAVWAIVAVAGNGDVIVEPVFTGAAR